MLSMIKYFTNKIPRIFLLHRFSSMGLNAKPSKREFEHFLNKLKLHFELTTTSDLFSRLNREKKLDKPLAVITVDDGYADFFDVALPVLADLHIPATVYVTAGFIDNKSWLWWDALRFLITHHPDGPLTLTVCGDEVILMIDDKHSRQAAWTIIADKLVRQNSERSVVMCQLEKTAGIKLPAHPTEDYKAMSWQQLAECQAAGIEIGCHTMTHAYLPALDELSLKHEIHEAKAIIEQRLSVPVSTFAYPNGMQEDVSEAVLHAVCDAGFQSAVMAYPRRFSLDSPYTIGRWSAIPNQAHLDHIISGMSYFKILVQDKTSRALGKKDVAEGDHGH